MCYFSGDFLFFLFLKLYFRKGNSEFVNNCLPLTENISVEYDVLPSQDFLEAFDSAHHLIGFSNLVDLWVIEI